MTEKDHYKYGLSGDKVDVEVAERLRAKIRTLAAEMASTKALWHEAKGTVRLREIRIREIEAELARAKNVLTNIAESDPNWRTAINNFLSKLTVPETFAEPDACIHGIRWMECAHCKPPGETACEHEYVKYQINNATSPLVAADLYEWEKCIRCGERKPLPVDAWLCQCGLVVKLGYACIGCFGTENSTMNRAGVK